MTSAPKPIIFDLDGTLVDSAPLCAGIINDMLRERGCSRQVTAANARLVLTKGGSQLVAALLGGESRGTDLEVAEFRSRYAARPTPSDCLFPGVSDGLRELAKLGVRMAICSNKPQPLCEKIASDLGLAAHFAAIVGSMPGQALKPAADLARLALTGLDAAPEDCLFVGDSEVDQQTACAAGIPFVFVTYGYAEPGFAGDGLARLDHFDQLVRFAAELRGPAPELTRVA